eukprot:6708421-Pyramimonas_sp.AAC.1
MSESRPGNAAGRPSTQWLGKPEAPARPVGDTSSVGCRQLSGFERRRDVCWRREGAWPSYSGGRRRRNSCH